MFNQPPDRATTLSLNYSILSNSCLIRKLPVIINAFNVMVYGVDAHLVEIGKKALGEPNRPILHLDLDAAPPVLGLVKYDVGTAFRKLAGLGAHSASSLPPSRPMRYLMS